MFTLELRCLINKYVLPQIHYFVVPPYLVACVSDMAGLEGLDVMEQQMLDSLYYRCDGDIQAIISYIKTCPDIDTVSSCLHKKEMGLDAKLL